VKLKKNQKKEKEKHHRAEAGSQHPYFPHVALVMHMVKQIRNNNPCEVKIKIKQQQMSREATLP
jgi:diacylglycerol kinase family enzyme